VGREDSPKDQRVSAWRVTPDPCDAMILPRPRPCRANHSRKAGCVPIGLTYSVPTWAHPSASCVASAPDARLASLADIVHLRPLSPAADRAHTSVRALPFVERFLMATEPADVARRCEGMDASHSPAAIDGRQAANFSLLLLRHPACILGGHIRTPVVIGLGVITALSLVRPCCLGFCASSVSVWINSDASSADRFVPFLLPLPQRPCT